MKIGNNGDDRFKSLYQRNYWRVVRFYVRAFRFSQEDAEELAQDAFLRFYAAMDDYRGDAEWAFFETIARHLAFNKIRSGKAQKRNAKTIGTDDPDFARLEPAADEGPDLAEREQQATRRRRLSKEIARLPRGQRESLQLWLDDFTYDEIAKTLRISMDAVKSRIRDAKKLLRERMGDETALPEDET